MAIGPEFIEGPMGVETMESIIGWLNGWMAEWF